MADGWQQARLIPTSGIAGPEEAERRATSALLAVMGAVREFGLVMVKPLGAPAGTLATFIEVPLKLGDKTVIPDGVIQTSRAGKTWTALVEVKTGSSDLERVQIESYLDAARDVGFDMVLTISNQLAPAPGMHPVPVDGRKLKKVELRHLSWAEILTIAVQQRVHRGVSDPDQAWILGELIRYLEHPRSGALDFADMGASWVTVREAVLAGTLRRNDKGLSEVVSRWEQLMRFAALRLGRELGAEVQVVVSRRDTADPAARFAAQADSLVSTGILEGELKIPDSIGTLVLRADLRTSRVAASVQVDAPREGRPLTRVNWLVRQLKDAPDGLRIDAFAASSRSSMSGLLSLVRADPTSLVEPSGKELRAFRITATSPLGPKRGVGRGGFIDSVLTTMDGFYRTVLQVLRPWSPRAPQLPPAGTSAAEAAGLELDPPALDVIDEPIVVGEIPQEVVISDAPADESDVVASADHEWLDRVPDEVPSELLSWDDEQAALERERSTFTVAVPAQEMDPVSDAAAFAASAASAATLSAPSLVSDVVWTEVRLLEEGPQVVVGERAFVLWEPSIGRIEVGSPPPHDEVWHEFGGDLMMTAVIRPDGGGAAASDGTWSAPNPSVLLTEPCYMSRGQAADVDGWVVVGRLDSSIESVELRSGSARVAQRPVRDTVALRWPVHTADGCHIVGRRGDGVEVPLYEYTAEEM